MSHKVVALVLAGVFVLSAASTAWARCGGWSPSVADRHACCAGGAMASESRATACCAMSEQSDDNGPTEGRVSSAPLQVIRHISPQNTFVTPAFASVLSHPIESVRNSSPVPLYLRQVSLLI